MPTYEYECDSCGKTFEEFQKMSDDPIKVCKFCGEPVRRLISGGSGLIFKGSGFYITDYKNKSTNCGPVESSCDKKESGSCCSDGACSDHS